MIKSSTEPIEEQFTCTITAVAVERETGADIVPSCTPITTCNEAGDVCWIDSDCSGNKNIGDVVALGTDENSIEQFYILDSDENNTEMMSMYNLYVGGDRTYITSVMYTPYENPTGIQDSTMLGYHASDTSIRRGVTVFSSDEQKGTNYSDYTGSIVEEYVNNYVTYLRDVLGVENTGTLITQEELDSLGCSSSGDTCVGAPSFLHSTTYWTRSAYDSTNIWHVNSDGVFRIWSYADYIGVRPVITINNEVFTRTIPSEPEGEVTYEDTDSSGTRNIGDIITLSKEGASTEQFYLLSEDGENITMMSMYNLYVGNECTNSNSSSCTPYENPTGIQDITMIGYVNGETIRRGTTAFSTTTSQYEGSIVADYVNNYGSYLANTLGIENTATLISKEEIETIVGTTLSYGDYLSTLGSPSFLYSTSY